MLQQRSILIAAACLAGMLPVATAIADGSALMHALFQDRAVLQRDRPIPVWGHAAPGAQVTVSIADTALSAQADSAGRWSVTLPAMAAGGPYSLSARTDADAKVIEDVMVGDVWLCSGQSNMVLQVHRSLDSRAEIASSANDTIRMLTVDQSSSPTPLETFAAPVEWLEAAPEVVGEFSAACFFFARELQKTVDVPMGLINAAWGGSRIESWMSRDALRAVDGYAARLDLLEASTVDRAAADRRWGKMWQAWWSAQPSVESGDEPWRASRNIEGNWRPAPAMLGPWEEWGDPELAHFDGLVWYRTAVTLTARQAGQAAVLSLGPIDEVDQTWVNGQPVGNGSGHDTPRRYSLPDGTLRPGENFITVAALDTYGSGGIRGPARELALLLADGTSVQLGAWRYRISPPGLAAPPRAPWESTGGLTTIRNGMIAPIGSYGIRGVAWYQGESNTADAANYERLLAGLVTDWRNVHGAELPVLVVQLANYGMPPPRPVESGWAEVREAQRRIAAQDPRVGLAVAIDIGDRYDIHPANKQEVGRRLARAARHVVYGETIPPSGPVPTGAHRDADAVIVTFGDITGELVAYGADGPIGFELCGAQRNSCRYVHAVIENERVVLRSPDGQVSRVRYCWADSPVCTLYDRADLPAGPFEISIRQERP